MSFNKQYSQHNWDQQISELRLRGGGGGGRRRLEQGGALRCVCAGGAARVRDGNGDPIPDSPRGIPLLGDGDGEVSSPTGM
jgi:hypothetical protein